MTYIQSTEEYRGYTLEIEMTQDYNHLSLFHRRCNVYKDGKPIAICKSKKEAKDLINYDCFNKINTIERR